MVALNRLQVPQAGKRSLIHFTWAEHHARALNVRSREIHSKHINGLLTSTIMTISTRPRLCIFPVLDLMRSKAFRCILSFLSLLGTVHASLYPIAECTAQAWVRAPDLAPDTIVRGDARVKISAGCPAVDTAVLGLRLKERSVIKALYDPYTAFLTDLDVCSNRRSHEDREKLDPAQFDLWFESVDVQRASPWDFPRTTFSNPTFQEILANTSLWVVREEERLVFETTQVVQMAQRTSGDHDVVQDFAILIPSTNFPPALDYSHSMTMMEYDPEVS